MTEDDFKHWLKTGRGKVETDLETDLETGGFLVPSLLEFPRKGIKARLWRAAGKLLMSFGLHGIGYVYYMKGAKSVNTLEYIQGKAR